MHSFKSKRFRDRWAASLLLAALSAALLSACGPQLIEGRPPFVSISSMALESGELSADFDIRNENEVKMSISAVEITVMVEDSTLVAHRDQFSLQVGASSAERIHVDHLPDDFTRSLLESLDSGAAKSLAFEVEGTVHTLEDGKLEFAHKGYLYPMPGRPGEFRAAVSQAEGLTRDEPY